MAITYTKGRKIARMILGIREVEKLLDSPARLELLTIEQGLAIKRLKLTIEDGEIVLTPEYYSEK